MVDIIPVVAGLTPQHAVLVGSLPVGNSKGIPVRDQEFYAGIMACP